MASLSASFSADSTWQLCGDLVHSTSAPALGAAPHLPLVHITSVLALGAIPHIRMKTEALPLFLGNWAERKWQGRMAQNSYPDTQCRELVTSSKIKMRQRNRFTESSRTLLKMVGIPSWIDSFIAPWRSVLSARTTKPLVDFIYVLRWEGLTPSGLSPSPLITPSLHSSLLSPLWASGRLCGSCFIAIFWTSLQIKFYLPSCHKVI